MKFKNQVLGHQGGGLLSHKPSHADVLGDVTTVVWTDGADT